MMRLSKTLLLMQSNIEFYFSCYIMSLVPRSKIKANRVDEIWDKKDRHIKNLFQYNIA